MTRIEDMRYIKLCPKDKAPMHTFDITYSRAEVEKHEDVGVKVDGEWVVLDVDTQEHFEQFYKIVQGENIKCNVMRSSSGRGGHFWFKCKEVLSNATGVYNDMGVAVDVRSHGKKCHAKVKHGGRWLPWLDPVYDFDKLDELPPYFKPFGRVTGDKKVKLEEMHGMSHGRNSFLYGHAKDMYRRMDKADTIKGVDLINKYIFATPLSNDELAKTVLRDDLFTQMDKEEQTKKKMAPNDFAEDLIKKGEIMRVDDKAYGFIGTHWSCVKADLDRKIWKQDNSFSTAQLSNIISYWNRMSPLVDTKETSHLVNCKNGVVDTDTLDIYDMTKETFITYQLDTHFNPMVTECEEVDNVMNKIFDGDQEVIDLTYEIMGTCLTTDVKQKIACILYGEGSNGKSTLLDMIGALLGEKNISSISLQDLSHRFRGSAIVDKLANLGDDISGEHISDTSVFKKLVTGNSVQLEHKGEDSFDYKNYATLIFSSNRLPYVADKSNGFQRRIAIIPFTKEFKKTDVDYDPHIVEKVTTEQAKSYLLNKALEGLKRLRENKDFTYSAKVEKIKQEYDFRNNTAKRYLSELQDINIVKNRRFEEVYTDYLLWCGSQYAKAQPKDDFVDEVNKFTKFAKGTKRQGQEVFKCWI